MRTTRLTKIAMVIFLSMIFFLGVQRPVLAADRNTTVKIPVEQIFEVNNSADADKTGSYVLIADQIQNPMPEGSNRRTFTWNMSGNSSTELIMNVGQVGEYHYKLYQATENKENYTYDSKTYDVTMEPRALQEYSLAFSIMLKRYIRSKMKMEIKYRRFHSKTRIPVKLVKIKTRFHLPKDQRILFIMVRR